MMVDPTGEPGTSPEADPETAAPANAAKSTKSWADHARVIAAGINPTNFLREAVQAVPEMKWAFAAGAVAAVAVIAAGWVKGHTTVLVVGGPMIIVLMFILVIFSRMAARTDLNLKGPTTVLIWFSVVALIIP